MTIPKETNPPEWFVVSDTLIAPYSPGARSQAYINRNALRLLYGIKRFQEMMTELDDAGSILNPSYNLNI